MPFDKRCLQRKLNISLCAVGGLGGRWPIAKLQLIMCDIDINVTRYVSFILLCRYVQGAPKK